MKTNIWKAGALILLCAAMTACSAGKNNNGNGTPATADNGPAPTDANGKTVVTMSILTKDRFLADAEQQFEAAHPDIDIQIDEVVPADTSSGDKMIMRQGPGPGQDSGQNQADVEKYATNVNAALMSGNAADIISMENLNVGKYADKGLLADWNELAGKDADFNKADYYENIFNGISQGGAMYGIPTSFTLDILLGDSSLLQQNGLDDKTWTWEQVVDLLKKTKTDGQYALSSTKPEDMLGFLAGSVYDQLVKKDGKSATFDAAAFQKDMEMIKNLYDSGVATADDMGPGNELFERVDMEHPIDVVTIPQMSGGSKTMLRPPGTGQDEGIPFKSNQVLALNSQSKVKDAAWSFVKFLLSEETQSSMGMMNFPVNKAALKGKLKETQDMISGSNDGNGKKGKIIMRGADGKEITPQLTDADIDKILNLMPSVGKYSNQDPKVVQMIIEEAGAYYSGSKSAKAVADSVANRINTYLNE